MHTGMPKLSIALAFRAVQAEQNSTNNLDLVPTRAALNKSTHYEYEIRSPCGFSLNFISQAELSGQKTRAKSELNQGSLRRQHLQINVKEIWQYKSSWFFFSILLLMELYAAIFLPAEKQQLLYEKVSLGNGILDMI